MISSKNSKKVLIFLFFIILVITSLVPIIYALKVSFDSGKTLLKTELSLIPEKFTVDKYKYVLVNLPFLTWLKNSLIVSSITVILSLLISVPAAYSLSRFEFLGKSL